MWQHAESISYNLHPPLLRRFGFKKKLQLGSWFRTPLKMLAGMRGVRIEINAGPQEPERWSAQLDLLRAAGADWYRDLPRGPRWRMILTEDQLTAVVLDKLFHAAAEYGARVTVLEQLPAPDSAPAARRRGLWRWTRRAAG